MKAIDKSKLLFNQIIDAVRIQSGDDHFLEFDGLFYKAGDFDLVTLSPKKNAKGIVRIVGDQVHFKISNVKIYF